MRIARAGRALTHLEALEAEAIPVIREVAAELERPVLLFSGGKDSIVLAHLARKAFRPAGALALNDLARVQLRLGEPLATDSYAESRATGAFILIDEATNDTVAAGMVEG